MTDESAAQITHLLEAVSTGDSRAQDQLWAVLYDELHAVARNQLADQAPGRTLQATTLVHETYLRLMGGRENNWANRKHFFSVAAQAMRHICVDHVRKRNRLKRGGGQSPVQMDDELFIIDADGDEILAVNESLDRLQAEAPRQAEVVTMRYFAGMTVEETAAALGVSTRTVENDWRFARTWLHRHIADDLIS